MQDFKEKLIEQFHFTESDWEYTEQDEADKSIFQKVVFLYTKHTLNNN